MADAASAGSATLSEAAQSILAVGQEAIEASSAEAPQAHDGADIIAPQQEEELDEGAKELQQAADEEAILDEPDVVAQAHLVGQSAGSADAQQEGEPDDENANHQPSAIEEELENEEGEGEEEEANAGGEAMDEDFQPDENERAQIAEELAGLGDGGERGAADEDVRYRPHSILDDEDDDDDEQQAAERSRKKKKTSHDRSNGEGAAAAFDEADGGEGSQLTEKERRKLELDRRIEQALKAGKKKRGRKADNVDEIDVFSDESVQELKREMMEAATRDEDANISKGLVIEKLKLLPKVMATLQKTHLQQAITDHNLLEGVRRWLEPLPDHSLPALNIQRSFFSALEKMPIDSISLKMSGLGKIMMFYSLNTKVDPKIRRSADRLIEIWSRPIIRKSSSFRDRSMPGADHDSSAVRIMGSQSAAGAGSNSQDASQSSGSTRMRVPQAVTGYSVVPRSAVATMGSGEGPSQARAKNAAKLRTFKSKLKESKQR
ncbi:unnamed protein product [Tilletia controversa]|uniref:TFIIS N-terminal domain-containing protein n=3 Tax=Tilletia TaxID=13289 RepID=A0A8X7MXS1_9BASI|nr:hypothetical protein CF336_g1152 [Tilletia laevis]KAE8204155.1 hypothetical protein CF328_g1241 [Tilletia controversa]KAE8264392.1 hypothetical protein A4X03_0g972 [Tilletia caries]KAE8207967.1 hypothetical protein CF335_g768 [Tilletia laevis]KAE8253088.1 hypothetical protein A4X06_0g1706 [Tilletia controversa]